MTFPDVWIGAIINVGISKIYKKDSIY